MAKKETRKVDLEAGDLIEHTTQDYGLGRVMEVKDGIATIAFKKVGKKLFPAGSRYLEPVDPKGIDEELPAEGIDTDTH